MAAAAAVVVNPKLLATRCRSMSSSTSDNTVGLAAGTGSITCASAASADTTTTSFSRPKVVLCGRGQQTRQNTSSKQQQRPSIVNSALALASSSEVIFNSFTPRKSTAYLMFPGHNVATFDFIPATKTYKKRDGVAGGSGGVYLTNTAYNGPVLLPLTSTDTLIANIFYGNTRVQIAVYDGQNATEDQFVTENLANSSTVRMFVQRINHGGFRVATTFDQATTNAYFGILKYYEMLFLRHKRVGVADRSHVLVSVANISFTNAFWTGFCMCYGNARDSGGQIKPLTSVDVCAHELTHGLQTFTTEFEYQGESGALNESCADIIATQTEFFVASTVDTPDYTLGEAFDFIIRDLSNPKACKQPTLYGGEYWVDPSSEEDNGGVHSNSGVTNYLGYLTSVGYENGSVPYVNETGTPVYRSLLPPTGLTWDVYADTVVRLLTSKKVSTRGTMKDFVDEMSNQFTSPKYTKYFKKCASAVGLLTPPLTFEDEDTPQPTPNPFPPLPLPDDDTTNDSSSGQPKQPPAAPLPTPCAEIERLVDVNTGRYLFLVKRPQPQPTSSSVLYKNFTFYFQKRSLQRVRENCPIVFCRYDTKSGEIGNVVSVYTFASEHKVERLFTSSDLFSNFLGMLDCVSFTITAPDDCEALVMKCEKEEWIEPLFVSFSS